MLSPCCQPSTIRAAILALNTGNMQFQSSSPARDGVEPKSSLVCTASFPHWHVDSPAKQRLRVGLYNIICK